MTTSEILKKLCESAYEPTQNSDTYKAIEEIMSPYSEKTESDAMGNLICHINGDGEKTVVLSAHMDKISMVITGIDKATGMLKIQKAGGIDMRTLAGARVKVIGKKIIYGCISSTPPHLAKGDRNKVPAIEQLYVDTGLSYDEVKEIVAPGDFVQYHSPVTPLLGTRFAGAYMDNSAGCAAVIKAVEKLLENGTKNKIIALFTTREEIGKGGAQTAFTRLQPDLALITDVSFGAGPGVPHEMSSPLSSGAMICISPVLGRDVSRMLIEKAEENKVSYTTEVMASRTMTDSDVAVIAGKGIKTGLASIPLLNMHTPVEILDLKDIESVAEILYLGAKGE